MALGSNIHLPSYHRDATRLLPWSSWSFSPLYHEAFQTPQGANSSACIVAIPQVEMLQNSAKALFRGALREAGRTRRGKEESKISQGMPCVPNQYSMLIYIPAASHSFPEPFRAPPRIPPQPYRVGQTPREVLEWTRGLSSMSRRVLSQKFHYNTIPSSHVWLSVLPSTAFIGTV